jgi:hypothetical protein
MTIHSKRDKSSDRAAKDISITVGLLLQEVLGRTCDACVPSNGSVCMVRLAGIIN